jgi:hypothetical protein
MVDAAVALTDLRETANLTQRTLMSLTVALADKAELDRQIEALTLALAVAHDLPGVLPAPAG